MRRRGSTAIIFQGLFLFILLLIILPNIFPSTKSKQFSWHKIRYTSSSPIPAVHGICPGLSTTTKPALVVARMAADDTTWLDSLSEKYHICAYTADAPFNSSSSYLQIPANRAHEALPYLTFLIDNYAHLPPAGAVFVHGSRFSWHNDDPLYDNLPLLTSLNIPSAVKDYGYHNLRCDWSAGTCDARDKTVKPQGSMETRVRANLEPWNRRAISDVALPGALGSVFGGSFGHDGDGDGGRGVREELVRLGGNDLLQAQCCAQFVVSKAAMLRHSREEYVALRQWLLDGNAASPLTTQKTTSQRQGSDAEPAPADDNVAGRIVSYIWHILFVDVDGHGGDTGTDGYRGVDLQKLNRLACPNAEECYCRLYGRCDLERCTEGSCPGQYRVPKGFKLPVGWAEEHSR